MAQGERSVLTTLELPQAVLVKPEGGPLTEAYSSSIAGDQYATASASMVSTSYESLEYETLGVSEEQIKAAIEKSREQGWSELIDRGQAAAAGCPSAQDALIWEELKKRDPRIFKDDVKVKLGQLIAEGGQAHIFQALIKLKSVPPLFFDDEWVAKVFKMEGFSLGDLQRQWPFSSKTRSKSKRVKVWNEVVLVGVAFSEYMDYCSRIRCGTFLKDGRFVFVMHRYWGDLRTLINCRLSCYNSQGPPFSQNVALKIIRDIAKGMRGLHSTGVLHRDLRAANVLITSFDDALGTLTEDEITNHEFRAVVADFESSISVQGSKFWRAPEVLQELQKKIGDWNIKIWTEKVDTYSYAMTCYEVLTGHLPFYEYLVSDWKRIINGERPHLPKFVDPQLGEIVKRCWHKDPSERPTFTVIIQELDNHPQARESG